MKTRNDGTKGKTAAEWIAEDAERDNRSNDKSYGSSLNYDEDEDDLDDDNPDDFNYNDDQDNVSADRNI